MEVKLVSHTKDPEYVCAKAMKVCRTQKDWYAIMPTRSDVERLLKLAVNPGKGKAPHESVLEHASFTFHILGISRSCSHQVVRHRIASFSQQSMRVIDFSNTNVDDIFVFPKTIQESLKSETCAAIRYHNALFDALNTYKELIKEGIPKEDARFVLPIATKTNIVITMNARELLHFFSLRMAPDAQWEIRKMATKMFELVSELMPSVFTRGMK